MLRPVYSLANQHSTATWHPKTRMPPIGFREWIIDFGDSGYVARYHIAPNAVTILAVRHQKEVGF
ncbi:MAG: type II toxin-antitoxin system RelE/ParE family toxin [Rhodoferax sp.]|nr:type II toxin-antitoxin system RelE/ParE family toxin [Rhodoferax sp.]